MAASAFIIRELGGDKRQVKLVTRALPYRNFDLEGEQRSELAWLPGSPEATITILGPEEKPTTINGEWKDKFFNPGDGGGEAYPFTLDNAPVTTVTEACEWIDSIRKMGQLVEVSWYDKVRRGILKKFKQSWKNEHDVIWDITFEWISQGEFIGAAVFIDSADVGSTFNVLKQQLEKLDDVGVPSAFPLHGDILSTLQGLQRTISGLVANVQDTIQNLADKVLSPVRAIRGIVASLTGIKSEAQIMIDYLNARVVGEFSATRAVELQTYNERLASALYREELVAWAKEMKRQATEQQASLEKDISTDVLATYVAKLGEDLRDVSRIYYDTPFEWRRIMVFNDLDSAELAAGQVVLVPRQNPSQAGQESPGD